MTADQKIQDNLDRNDIKDMLSIVNYARDSGLGEDLREDYHPDVTLTTSWFNGTRDEFINGSKKNENSSP